MRNLEEDRQYVSPNEEQQTAMDWSCSKDAFGQATQVFLEMYSNWKEEKKPAKNHPEENSDELRGGGTYMGQSAGQRARRRTKLKTGLSGDV